MSCSVIVQSIISDFTGRLFENLQNLFRLFHSRCFDQSHDTRNVRGCHASSLERTKYRLLSSGVNCVLQNTARSIALFAIFTPCDHASRSRYIDTCTIVRIGSFFASRTCGGYRNYLRIASWVKSGITIGIACCRNDHHTFFVGIVDRFLHELALTTTTKAHINHICAIVCGKDNCFSNIRNCATS